MTLFQNTIPAMFNIHFFQKTLNLKKRITNGELSKENTKEIYDTFEQQRSEKAHVFNIETTNHCNMKCIMCPRTELMTRAPQNMTDADYLKILKQVRPFSTEELNYFWKFLQDHYDYNPTAKNENTFYFHIVSGSIVLHGYGEPLLDRKIVDRVHEAHKMNLLTYFSCVPANLTLERAEQLMNAGLTTLKVSIDSLSDDKQKKIRGPQNNYTKSIKTVFDVIALRDSLKLKTLIVPTMIALSEDDQSQSEQKEFLSLWKDQKDVFAYVKSQDNRWLYEDASAPTNQSHHHKQFCEFPWVSLTINADGSVVPCAQDYDSEMVFGNIKTHTLAEIWNSPAYDKFRKWHIEGNFPKGHKCASRCDQKKVYQYLNDGLNQR